MPVAEEHLPFEGSTTCARHSARCATAPVRTNSATWSGSASRRYRRADSKSRNQMVWYLPAVHRGTARPCWSRPTARIAIERLIVTWNLCSATTRSANRWPHFVLLHSQLHPIPEAQPLTLNAFGIASVLPPFVSRCPGGEEP